MDTIIAYRVNGGPVQVVLGDEEEIKVWPHLDKAIKYVLANRLFKSGQADYQIISLDEL